VSTTIAQPPRQSMWGSWARSRAAVAIVALFVLGGTTWLYRQMQRVDREAHQRVDSALRELRGLDRTINQDVLRARFQLIGSYDPVRGSYRRIEELEAVIGVPPMYLAEDSARAYRSAVAGYRDAVTRKQRTIETFKYRTADLKELLGYLPEAGTGVSAAAVAGGDRALAEEVQGILQLALLYNLTSDESYAPVIREKVDALARAAQQAAAHGVKRRVLTFVRNIERLLRVKPEVDALLVQIFDEPVAQHEETVAGIYYDVFAQAERRAGMYRVALYTVSLSMLGAIAFVLLRLQHTAKALASSNERLEERVADRTRELAMRTREMQAVLDNVDAALFMVDVRGRISAERSAKLDLWFPAAESGRELWSVLQGIDPRAAQWIELGFGELEEGVMPAAVVLGQLPQRIYHEGKCFQFEYRPISSDGGQLERVLLVVSNVTELVESSQREVDQREQLVVFQHLLHDRPGLLEFLSESSRLVGDVLHATNEDRAAMFRAVHTLKGSCALYGLGSIAAVCHELEAKMVDSADDLSAEDIDRIAEAWTGFVERVRRLTDGARESVIELSHEDLSDLRRAVRTGESGSGLLRRLDWLARDPAEARLRRMAEQALGIARRLRKRDLVISIDGGDVRTDRERWAAFWAALVHVLRNAVDHGIEREEERIAAGKPRAGRLSLRTYTADEVTVVEIADDGGGIHWDAIRAKAHALGRDAGTEAELCAVLFAGGVSTKAAATEISGRGTGVSACYEACVAMGGRVEVESRRGAGTTFRFVIPSDDLASTAGMSSVA